MPYADPEKRRAYKQAWAAKNRERLLAQKKDHYQANKDRYKELCAQRYREKREHIRAKQQEYSARTSAQAVARVKEWRKANPEKYKTQTARLRDKHREKRRAAERARYRANPEKLAEARRRWVANNPEKVKAIHHRARARRRGAQGSYSEDDINRLLATQNGRCAGCAKKFCKSRPHTIDHVTPLALGGTNNPDNIQLLCGYCNKSKNATPPDEWAARIGKLFI